MFFWHRRDEGLLIHDDLENARHGAHECLDLVWSIAVTLLNRHKKWPVILAEDIRRATTIIRGWDHDFALVEPELAATHAVTDPPHRFGDVAEATAHRAAVKAVRAARRAIIRVVESLAEKLNPEYSAGTDDFAHDPYEPLDRSLDQFIRKFGESTFHKYWVQWAQLVRRRSKQLAALHVAIDHEAILASWARGNGPPLEKLLAFAADLKTAIEHLENGDYVTISKVLEFEAPRALAHAIASYESSHPRLGVVASDKPRNRRRRKRATPPAGMLLLEATTWTREHEIAPRSLPDWSVSRAFEIVNPLNEERVERLNRLAILCRYLNGHAALLGLGSLVIDVTFDAFNTAGSVDDTERFTVRLALHAAAPPPLHMLRNREVLGWFSNDRHVEIPAPLVDKVRQSAAHYLRPWLRVVNERIQASLETSSWQGICLDLGSRAGELPVGGAFASRGEKWMSLKTSRASMTSTFCCLIQTRKRILPHLTSLEADLSPG